MRRAGVIQRLPRGEWEMGPFVYFNRQFMPAEDATVSIATHGLNYGTGCFEGIRAYYSESRQATYVLKLREHYQRFVQNCGILRIDVGHTVDELCDLTVQLVAKNQSAQDLYIRPLAFKADLSIRVTLEDLTDAFGIFTMPLGNYLPVNGIHVTVSSWRRVEDNAIPSRAKITGSYVNTALAVSDAHLSGFDDAIFLSEDGHVAEGSAANLFIVRQGQLVTSTVSDNILEGITRQGVCDIARARNLSVIERPIDRTELYVADEMFFVGTGAQVSPVTRIDHRLVGQGEVGPITRMIQDEYFRAVRGEVPEYRHWLTEVSPSPVYGSGV